MIILNASVLIAHFEPADEHHDTATALLHARRGDRFAASVITLAEIFVGAARSGQMQRAQALVEQLCVEGIELPTDAAHRLAEIRAMSRLKLPDCCVLYTAEQRRAAVATFDIKLAEQAELLGISVASQAT